MTKNSNSNLNDIMLKALHVSRESGVPVFFISNPGFGKTTLMKDYCEMTGDNLVDLRGSDYSPEDILGFPVNNKGQFERLVPDWFKKLSHDKPNVLFIDELTTANSYTQAALLSVIFDKKVADRPLPPDTFIVAAGNYSKNLSDSFALMSPIVNRFMFVNMKSSPNDIDLFLGLSKYVKWDPTKIDKRELTAEKIIMIKEYVKKVITYFQKTVGLDFNYSDHTGIYVDQDYIINATTLRSSVHYLNKVLQAMYVNDMLEERNLIELFVDGLMGHGLKKPLGQPFVNHMVSSKFIETLEGDGTETKYKTMKGVKPEFHDLTYDQLKGLSKKSVESLVDHCVQALSLWTKDYEFDHKKAGPIVKYCREVMKDDAKALLLEGKMTAAEYINQLK